MKKLLLALAFPFCLLAQAQTEAAGKIKEGRVVYEHRLHMEPFFKTLNAEMPDRMPGTLTETFELLFAGAQSLWQPLPDAAEEAAMIQNTGGNSMRIARWGAADAMFCDFEKGLKVTQTELHAKQYLVEDSIGKWNWNLLNETKELLGYTVRKATAFQYGTRVVMGLENGELKPQTLPDTTVVVAWYAADIAVAAGPGQSGQLPGLILELNENNGRSVYKAIEIAPVVNSNRIKEPKGGKRMAAAAFRRQQQAEMADLQQRMQSGGPVSMPLAPGN
jgi:GLPGLI family protein